MFGEQGCNRVDDIRVVELDRRKIDRDPHTIRPIGCFRDGGMKDELTYPANHAAFFGQRE